MGEALLTMEAVSKAWRDLRSDLRGMWHAAIRETGQKQVTVRTQRVLVGYRNGLDGGTGRETLRGRACGPEEVTSWVTGSPRKGKGRGGTLTKVTNIYYWAGSEGWPGNRRLHRK